MIAAMQDIDLHTAEYTEQFANPMEGAKRGFIDAVIEPDLTRKVLCSDLRVLRTKNLPNLPRKHSNIPL